MAWDARRVRWLLALTATVLLIGCGGTSPTADAPAAGSIRTPTTHRSPTVEPPTPTSSTAPSTTEPPTTTTSTAATTTEPPTTWPAADLPPGIRCAELMDPAIDDGTLDGDLVAGWAFTTKHPIGATDHGCRVVSAADGHPVRSGDHAFRFEVRDGDCSGNDGWDDCTTDRSRHELSQWWADQPPQYPGDEYWYGWSVLLPTEPLKQGDAVTFLGQFNTDAAARFYLEDFADGLGFRFNDRNYEFLDHGLLADGDEVRGRWLDVALFVRWSEDSDGRIEVYLDGRHRRTLSGANLDGATRATFDFGIYDAFLSECACEAMPTQVAYYDEVRRSRTRDGLDPDRRPEPVAATPTTTVAPVPTPVPTTTTTDPCSEKPPFRHPPVDLDATEYMVPMGLMTGSHVTPVDHAYFQNWLQPDRPIDVYTPEAGTVTHIQRMGAILADDGDVPIDDYRLVVDHPCRLTSIYIHVTTLADRLAAVAPGPGGHASVNVVVDPGELLGTYVRNVDYNLVDDDVTVDGLLVPATYVREPWKVHTVDFLPYFEPGLRERIAALSLRTAEPRSGRFAYDVDGRLVGNWFVDGTDGYAGTDPDRYWAGHLAFAYHHYDPTAVMVSVGTFDGRSTQGVVTGNAPDPATVDTDTGLVLYELRDFDLWSGDERWDQQTHALGVTVRPAERIHGTLAVRMVDDRRLLVEGFPGLSPDEVDGLTDAAVAYVR